MRLAACPQRPRKTARRPKTRRIDALKPAEIRAVLTVAEGGPESLVSDPQFSSKGIFIKIGSFVRNSWATTGADERKHASRNGR